LESFLPWQYLVIVTQTQEKTPSVHTTQKSQVILVIVVIVKLQSDLILSALHVDIMVRDWCSKNQMASIGIDLMGGEVTPDLISKAIIEAKELRPELDFHLFATKAVSVPKGFTVSYADSVISMEDAPLKAIRSKKRSTILLGMQALQEKRIGAFLSCGNTGALIAATHLFLEPLHSITRPALAARLPTTSGSMVVLDVGAHLMTKAVQLVELALLGSCLSSKSRPKVALLNIGVESVKGTKELQEAYRLFSTNKNPHFEFMGNIEPKEVWKKEIDVLVTSGFAGNIFLKTAVSDEAARGALVVGCDGIVIKCHGSSSKNAIRNAIVGIDLKLIDRMRSRLI
jgi:phosphate acyltransferase